jgi:hypothetical protein
VVKKPSTPSATLVQPSLNFSMAGPDVDLLDEGAHLPGDLLDADAGRLQVLAHGAEGGVELGRHRAGRRVGHVRGLLQVGADLVDHRGQLGHRAAHRVQHRADLRLHRVEDALEEDLLGGGEAGDVLQRARQRDGVVRAQVAEGDGRLPEVRELRDDAGAGGLHRGDQVGAGGGLEPVQLRDQLLEAVQEPVVERGAGALHGRPRKTGAQLVGLRHQDLAQRLGGEGLEALGVGGGLHQPVQHREHRLQEAERGGGARLSQPPERRAEVAERGRQRHVRLDRGHTGGEHGPGDPPHHPLDVEGGRGGGGRERAAGTGDQRRPVHGGGGGERLVQRAAEPRGGGRPAQVRQGAEQRLVGDCGNAPGDLASHGADRGVCRGKLSAGRDQGERGAQCVGRGEGVEDAHGRVWFRRRAGCAGRRRPGAALRGFGDRGERVAERDERVGELRDGAECERVGEGGHLHQRRRVGGDGGVHGRLRRRAARRGLHVLGDRERPGELVGILRALGHLQPVQRDPAHVGLPDDVGDEVHRLAGHVQLAERVQLVARAGSVEDALHPQPHRAPPQVLEHVAGGAGNAVVDERGLLQGGDPVHPAEREVSELDRHHSP